MLPTGFPGGRSAMIVALLLFSPVHKAALQHRPAGMAVPFSGWVERTARVEIHGASVGPPGTGRRVRGRHRAVSTVLTGVDAAALVIEPRTSQWLALGYPHCRWPPTNGSIDNDLFSLPPRRGLSRHFS